MNTEYLNMDTIGFLSIIAANPDAPRELNDAYSAYVSNPSAYEPSKYLEYPSLYNDYFVAAYELVQSDESKAPLSSVVNELHATVDSVLQYLVRYEGAEYDLSTLPDPINQYSKDHYVSKLILHLRGSVAVEALSMILTKNGVLTIDDRDSLTDVLGGLTDLMNMPDYDDFFDLLSNYPLER